MKNKIFICCSLLVFATFITQWRYMPNDASIKFYVKEKNGTEEGTFKGIVGDFQFDENNLKNSKFTATINVNTINTGMDMRDESLLSSDFFEVKKYPTISFKSASIIKTDTGYCATGILKIKDVEKNIELPFSFKKQNDSTALLKGNFSINRYDYNVGKINDGVGNMVKIELNMLVKK